MSLITSVQNKKIIIAWVRHLRRNQFLAEEIGGEAAFIYYFKRRNLFLTLVRYLISIFSTSALLLRTKPAVVISVNQPIFCVWVCTFYGMLSGAKILLDHHAGAFNFRKTAWARPFLAMAVKRATLNIAHCDDQIPKLTQWGGRSMTLAAMPFTFPSLEARPLNQPAVVMICTFSSDEPVGPVLAAAGKLPETHFYITGDLAKAHRWQAKAPPNVTFTGFLTGDDYLATLLGARAVMCLTTRNETPQRGNSETMSLKQPLVTSDWPVLRRTFPKGAVFVKPDDADSIAAGVRQAMDQRKQLQQGMQELYIEAQQSWAEGCDRLRAVLAEAT